MQRRASLERLRIMQVSRSAFVYAVLLIAALIAIGPFVWAVSSVLKIQGELFFVPPVLVPPDPQWVNYVHVFDQIPLVRLFLNTAFYAGVVTVGQVAFCSLAGYGFARLAFAGRDKIFLAYL